MHVLNNSAPSLAPDLRSEHAAKKCVHGPADKNQDYKRRWQVATGYAGSGKLEERKRTPPLADERIVRQEKGKGKAGSQIETKSQQNGIV